MESKQNETDPLRNYKEAYKGMCINTKYNMSIIEKVFHYEATELSVIKCKDEIWFRGKAIAEVLWYSNPLKVICTHINSEEKREISELSCNSRGAQNGPPFKNEMSLLKFRSFKMEPLTNNQKNTIYINESGLYCLILHSKLKSACVFKRWVTSQVCHPFERLVGTIIV